MLNGYKNSILNGHGLKALVKSPTLPNENLGVGDDDNKANIPLLIFCDQHLPIPGPVVDTLDNMAYEKVAAKGKADFVTIDNFVTDNFDLGNAIDGF